MMEFVPFQEHCRRVTVQVTRYQRNRRGIVSDTDHRWLKYWDMVRSSAVLFLTIVSPVEITMRENFEVSRRSHLRAPRALFCARPCSTVALRYSPPRVASRLSDECVRRSGLSLQRHVLV